MRNTQIYIDFFESKLKEANLWGKKGEMGMVRSTMKDSVELLLDLIWKRKRVVNRRKMTLFHQNQKTDIY